jgi:hypothetical protein
MLVDLLRIAGWRRQSSGQTNTPEAACAHLSAAIDQFSSDSLRI